MTTPPPDLSERPPVRTGRGSDRSGGERWIDLAGADNTRDLGGLPVAGGGRTRRGRLIRSGTLQGLTPEDVHLLVRGIGVRTVVDLRMVHEAEREGSALSGQSDLRYLSLPLLSGDRVRSDAIADTEMNVVDHYVAFLGGSASTMVTAARAFADEEWLPALFHCAAGKDRTGILAAVVLDAVGVTHEAIVDDYALTEQRLDAIQERLAPLETYRRMRALAPGRGVMTASADTMLGFLEHLGETHGGGAGYLTAHGLAADELQALREALVDPDAG